MLLKIVYLLTRRVLGLAVLAFRGDLAKDAELELLASYSWPGDRAEPARPVVTSGTYL